MTTRGRYAGAILTLLTAILAQIVLAGGAAGLSLPWPLAQRLAAGGATLLLALVLAAWTWRGGEEQRGLAAGMAGPWQGRRPWALALAGLCYLASLGIVLLSGENGWARGLWLAGMALLVAAYWSREDLPRWSREDGRDLLILGGIMAIGFVLRFWHLPAIPSDVHGDVASMGMQALDLLRDGRIPWFATGWAETPMVDYLLMALSMRVFGQDLLGLAMTSVLQGLLALPAFYLLGRELFGRRTGLLAAWLLAISYTHIHFSRTINNGSPVPFLALGFYFLFRGRRTGHGAWFALAGVLIGFSQLLYVSSRAAVIVVALLLLWLLLFERARLRSQLWGWGVFVAGALAGFGPMLAFVANHFEAFLGRTRIVTLANPGVIEHLSGKYGVEGRGQVLVEQIKRVFLTFHFFPDASTQFAFPGPFVDALTALLLVVGVGIALARLRQPRYFTLLAWLLLTLILGGVLTNDPPWWPHLIVLLPALLLLAAAAGISIWRILARPLPGRGRQVLGLALLAGLLGLGLHNWSLYLAHVENNATPSVQIARTANTLPGDTQVYLVREPHSWQERELAFFGRKVRAADVEAERVRGGELPPAGGPTVFVLTPNHADLIPTLQAQYTSGVLQEHYSGNGALSFYTYAVHLEASTGAPSPQADAARRARAIWLGAGLLLLAILLAGALIVRRAPAEEEGESDEAAVAGSIAALAAESPPEAEPAAPQAKARPGRAARRSPRTHLLAFLLMLLAVTLAVLGQHFFDARLSGPLLQPLVSALALETTLPAMLSAGAILYVAAMILFALAAPDLAPIGPQSEAPPLPEPRRRELPGRYRPDARVRRYDQQQADTAPTAGRVPVPAQTGGPPALRGQGLLLLLALAPYLVALWRFQTRGEDAAVRWLWLAGVALFLAGQVLWPAWRGLGGHAGERSPRFRPLHLALLLAILAAAFYLRFDRLESIPSDLHGDMASMGIQARDWLSWNNKVLFREGWANIPLIGFLPSALFLHFFGNDLFALNLSAVAAGMLTLLGLYLLVWRLFDSHRLAALATAVLAINTAHIHFSRLAAYMDPWPFNIFALLFLVDGLRGRRPQSLALAGLLLGFGIQMYYSGRVIVFILLLAFLYLLLMRRRWLQDNWRGWVLLGVGGLIALGPSLLYFGGNWEAFVERSRSVFLFYDPVMTHLLGKYGLDSENAVILEQLKRSLLMFNYSIDTSTQFGYPHPMFNSLISPLVVLGAGFALRRWRRIPLGLTLIWLLMLLLFGSILTNNAPFWPRLVGILPAAAILAALALDRLWQTVAGVLRERPAVHWLAAAAAAALLVVAGWQNYRLYTGTVANNARAQAFLGRYLSTLPPEISACAFSDPLQLNVRETSFLASPRRLVDLPGDAPNGLIDSCPGPPFVWIIFPNHAERLPAIQARWPGGQAQEHYYGNGAFAFTSYLVSDGALPEGGPNRTFTSPLATPPPASEGFSAYEPDGSAFQPQQQFMGNTASSVWEINAGRVRVTGGRFSFEAGPIPGHNAVFDYIKLAPDEGEAVLFEAEEGADGSGVPLASHEGADGQWWLQSYDRFSGGQALVAQKDELVPVIRISAPLPDGDYTLFVGSFTGDPANGVFALGVRWN